DITQQGIFDNLSGTVTSKIVRKVSNDEIYVYSKKPFSNEYLEFQFKDGIYTENNSAGNHAELLRLTGVYNLTDAYRQLTITTDKASGWDEYLVTIRSASGIPNARNEQLRFQRNTTSNAWIEFDVYVDENGEFNLGLYMTNTSANSVDVKVGSTVVAN